MTTILHLMRRAEWERHANAEAISNESLSAEGFIHCTDEPAVMLQVANAFYRGQSGNFVVLHIDADALDSDCVWEAPANLHRTGIRSSGATDRAVASVGEDVVGTVIAPLFPHVYGPINRGAVIGVQSVLRDPTGQFIGYGELDSSD